MRWLVLVSIPFFLGADLRTPNFQITAPDPQVAEFIGKWAEHHRRQHAVQWLGKEMPQWNDPCPLSVQVTTEQPQGMTLFGPAYGPAGMHMSISGPLDRLVSNVLPHEITHTIFDHYYRCPLPLWAAEGAAILAENEERRQHYAKLAKQFLEQGKLYRLRSLLIMTDYPNDPDSVLAVYCQGFAVADYLVKQKDRPTFLHFISEGLATSDWERAVQSYYGFKGLSDLEEHWVQYVMRKRVMPAAHSERRLPRTVLATDGRQWNFALLGEFEAPWKRQSEIRPLIAHISRGGT